MAYTRLNLKNGTKLTEEHLKHIEDGIEKNSTDILNLDADLPYCNYKHNLGVIGEFLAKYALKQVDEYNQLTVCMAGDSIFGRVDKGTSWKEDKPEISYTPDVNNPNETLYGYQTGHYPPNMWEQTVPYKTLKLLQYKNADVKYYNYSASEISLQGSWSPTFPAGADSIRTTVSNSSGATILFSFTGVKFIKAIFTCYSVTSANSKMKIEFSVDNGATWKTPSELSLTSNIAGDSNGIYQLPSTYYKWPNICFKGFDTQLSYTIRITNQANKLNFWGFETWSNPRINVIVVAEGGNTAKSQATQPQRFYSEMYNPSLVIYELPYLNDLGQGPLARFKNKISPTSSAPSSPTTQDFYYCKEDGNYTNFGSITAKAGDYIEFDGSGWKLGSSKLKEVMSTYMADNTTVFERLRKQGIPVITIITHTGTYDIDRPFGTEIGAPILRGLVGKYGFAVLDVNYYQRIKGYYATANNVIHADSTHLNDRGVQMYMDLISLLFTIPYPNQYAGTSNYAPRPLFGSGTGGTPIAFGFEFSEIPNVIISGGTNIVITSITKSGFTTTGSGDFQYMATI